MRCSSGAHRSVRFVKNKGELCGGAGVKEDLQAANDDKSIDLNVKKWWQLVSPAHTKRWWWFDAMFRTGSSILVLELRRGRGNERERGALCALKRWLGWLAESSGDLESSWELDLTSISTGFWLNLGGYLTSAEERTVGELVRRRRKL